MTASYLDKLENRSISIIRDAFSQRQKLALLWSMGKDSTVLLHLVRKAFLGNVPIPLLHIDTTLKIPEMIVWRDNYVQKHGLKLLTSTNNEALSQGMGPEKGRLACCGALKTAALLKAIEEFDLQGLFLGIRRDEEGSRGKERVVSPRSSSSEWAYKSQPAEIWDYYNLHIPKEVHLRIHPLLHWTELDIWRYIEQEKLELIPLYFAREGKRYRSLGCYPCTAAIESEASTIPEIIQELKTCNSTERAGRAQDQADAYAMQLLRTRGYM